MSDGDGSIGYLVIMAIAAIIGLLITSVLIGIFTTAIEEYVEGLKESKSTVLEKDHIIILGFTPGEYTLIKQVVLAAGTKKRTIVIGSDTSSEEMREAEPQAVHAKDTERVVVRMMLIYSDNTFDVLTPRG